MYAYANGKTEMSVPDPVVLDFSGAPARLDLPRGTDALTGAPAGGETELPVNGIKVIRE